MSEDTPKKDTRFKPGHVRSPSSGMQPGQRTKKVLQREADKDVKLQRILDLSEDCKGLSPAEVCDKLGFNVAVALIIVATDPNETGMTRLKAISELKTITSPTLKSSEVRSEEVHTLRVEYQNPFDPPTIDVTPEALALPPDDDE